MSKPTPISLTLSLILALAGSVFAFESLFEARIDYGAGLWPCSGWSWAIEPDLEPLMFQSGEYESLPLVSDNPSSPLFKSRHSLHDEIPVEYVGSAIWTWARDVWVSGDYAYCTMWFGLVIVDISDPSAPTLLSRLYTEGIPNGLQVAGNYAYIAGGGGPNTLGCYLTVVDVSDPSAPEIVANLEPGPYSTADLTVVGDYVYLAANGSGLWIVGVSDPTDPQLIGVYDWGDARDVEVVGSYAYVSFGSTTYMGVVDVQDPANPEHVSLLRIYDYNRGIAVAGDYAYIANDDSGVAIVDISSVTPTLVMNYDIDGKVWDVTVDGNYLYVAVNTGIYDDLKIIDISNPLSPVEEGSFRSGGCAWGVKVNGSYAFVATERQGLLVIDVSSPNSPAFEGTFNENPGGKVSNVEIKGDLAYVSHSEVGLEIFDMSDPANPALLGTCPESRCYCSAVSGNYAYLGCRYQGITSFDISNPAEPAWLGKYNNHCHVYDIKVAGDLAYVTADTAGFQILDISDPANITEVGRYDMPGYCKFNFLDRSGNYVYVGYWLSEDNSRGLLVIDVTDPTSPTLVREFPTSQGRIMDVLVKGNYVYIAEEATAVSMIDISDPADPVTVGCWHTDSLCIDPYGIDVWGDFVYVVNRMCLAYDLKIVDFSEPSNPLWVGNHTSPGFGLGVAVSGSNIYLAEWYGLVVLSQSITTFCGDIDGNGAGPNVADLTYLVDYLFFGGQAPPVLEAANVDGQGGINVADLTYLVDYLFFEGPAPDCAPIE